MLMVPVVEFDKERLKDKLRNFDASGGRQYKGAAEVREEES